MAAPDSLLALAADIDPRRAADLSRDLGAGPGRELGVALGTAYPPLTPVHGWQVEAMERIAAEGWRAPRDRDAVVGRLLRAASDLSDPEQVQSALRRQVWAQRARIALRELVPPAQGGAGVDVTARELSDLAEAAFDVALAEAGLSAARRFGEPLRADGEHSTLVVLGMGKLGGFELNAGSDIDIILIYDTDEGGSSVSLHEHWTYVARRAVATIETPTEDGIVWRVDLRLRPEGSRGPLVYSWASAERYYETWGRLWERVALLRARPIAGDRRLGQVLEREVLAPFVFRRSVEPAIATALAELIQRSRAELSEAPARDLKLGPGGIREAEFFVQALQLIWGGREPSLRVPGTLTALGRLQSRGLVSDREAGDVGDAYLLLRAVEHAVQWRAGIQTHLLPTDGDELERLARIRGFRSASDLAVALSQAQSAVSQLFASLSPEAPRPPPRYTVLLGQLERGDPEVASTIERYFGDVDVTDHLLALARRPDGVLGAATRERFPELADQVIEAVVDCSDPEQAARYLRSFFGRLLSPTSYVTSLAREPRALSRLVTVLGASAFVGDAVVARPDLADLLLFGTPGVSTMEVRRVVAEAVQTFERQAHPALDPDERRDAFVGTLRGVKGKVMVEIAVADLAGELEVREVTRILSDLADEVLEHTVRFELGGEPRGLSVMAVGKLGGRDIGYGADLDVLFIYDPEAAPPGRYPAEHFTRCAQRIIRLISTPHPAGPGYELDTRLRPSGSQGLLVTSLESFARYHRVRLGPMTPDSDAPTVLSSGAAWERQALLRARPCGGDLELGAAVIEVAHAAAYGRGAPSPEEIHRLRLRMEHELARERAGRYDLKVGRGGLLDIEFAAQWLQMRHGADPRVRTTDTLEALEALRACGYLAAPAYDTFRDGYTFLRRLEQRIQILHGSGSSVIDVEAPGLEKLARRMGVRRTPDASEAGALIASYRDVTESVRSAYLETLGVQ